MLNKTKNGFNKLEKKTIIEIFSVVIVMFVFLVIYTKDIKFYEETKKVTSRFDGDIYEIYSQIKKIEDISIQKSNINKNSLNIELLSSLEHILFIINKIENINEYIHIKNYEISLKDDLYNLKIEVALSKQVKKQKIFEVPYMKVTQNKEIKTQKQTKFHLSAIVFTSAMINNKPLKINEKINGYKLVKIKKNSVVLSSKNKNIEVYLDETRDE